MSSHVFVDEHKVRRHTLVAVAVPTGYLATARHALRRLVMPGQRCVHFAKEHDARRRLILNVIRDLDVRASIYSATSYPDQALGRAACLTALVDDLSLVDVRRLVIETDDAAVSADRALLYELVRKHDLQGMSYHHLRAHEERLLSIADAIAWCYGKGGPWRAGIDKLVAEVRRL